MPKFEITSPDGRRFEITAPEGATKEQVLSYAQKQFSGQADTESLLKGEAAGTLSLPEKKQLMGMRKTGQVPQSNVFAQQAATLGGRSDLQNFLAGMGQSIYSTGRGLGQLTGLTSDEAIREAEKLDVPLMGTKAGMGGAITGHIGQLVGPGLALKGAATAARGTALAPKLNLLSKALLAPKTLKQAAAIGGVYAGTQPVTSDNFAMEKAKQIGLGAAAGAVGKYAGEKVGGYFAGRAAKKAGERSMRMSQQGVRDNVLKAGRGLGYGTTPSYAEAGGKARLLEGLSGQAKTKQLLAIKNQKVTENVIRREFGLPQDTPLSPELMQSIRSTAHEAGYEPIRQVGRINTDNTFRNSLNKIISKSRGIARSFPGAADDTAEQMANTLNVKSFDSSDAIDMVQQLRNDAGKAYASGDRNLGQALKSMADAVEGQIERNLEKAGKSSKELLNAFREARKTMAKTHTVEKSFTRGQVSARKIGAAYEKAPKKFEGSLKTIGQYAQKFPEVMEVPKSGWGNPLSVLDYAYGGLGLAVGPQALAIPAARVGARHLISSPFFQRAAVNPQYGSQLLTRGLGKLGSPVGRQLPRAALAAGLAANQ